MGKTYKDSRVYWHYRAYIKHLQKEHPMMWKKYRKQFDDWLPKPPRLA